MPGTLTLKNLSGGTIQVIDLGAPAVECSSPTGTVTTSGNGTTATLTSHTAPTVAGQHFIWTETTTISAIYFGTLLTITVVTTGTFRRSSTSSAACTPLPGSGNCTVQANNITTSGTTSSPTYPTLASGDTITMSGGNTAFNTVVTGTAANCGTLTALNNGSVTYTGEVLGVL